MGGELTPLCFLPPLQLREAAVLKTVSGVAGNGQRPTSLPPLLLLPQPAVAVPEPASPPAVLAPPPQPGIRDVPKGKDVH